MSSQAQIRPFNMLSDDIVGEIFSFFGIIHTFSVASRVCRRWAAIVRSNSFSVGQTLCLTEHIPDLTSMFLDGNPGRCAVLTFVDHRLPQPYQNVHQFRYSCPKLSCCLEVLIGSFPVTALPLSDWIQAIFSRQNARQSHQLKQVCLLSRNDLEAGKRLPVPIASKKPLEPELRKGAKSKSEAHLWQVRDRCHLMESLSFIGDLAILDLRGAIDIEQDTVIRAHKWADFTKTLHKRVFDKEFEDKGKNRHASTRQSKASREMVPLPDLTLESSEEKSSKGKKKKRPSRKIREESKKRVQDKSASDLSKSLPEQISFTTPKLDALSCTCDPLEFWWSLSCLRLDVIAWKLWIWPFLCKQKDRVHSHSKISTKKLEADIYTDLSQTLGWIGKKEQNKRKKSQKNKPIAEFDWDDAMLLAPLSNHNSSKMPRPLVEAHVSAHQNGENPVARPKIESNLDAQHIHLSEDHIFLPGREYGLKEFVVGQMTPLKLSEYSTFSRIASHWIAVASCGNENDVLRLKHTPQVQSMGNGAWSHSLVDLDISGINLSLTAANAIIGGGFPNLMCLTLHLKTNANFL